ncbi:MAG: heavy metal-associated domain-containing protein [Gammaproteobacteria bacterium]
MNRLSILGVFLIGSVAWADHGHNKAMEMEAHSHEGHLHETLVDGKQLEVDAERFDNFIKGLSDTQVAIVSVNGMVCDFCARGIEKTFAKDALVKKIDVDLNRGKVLIAYSDEIVIDFEDIKKKIIANGQNATDLQILSI